MDIAVAELFEHCLAHQLRDDQLVFDFSEAYQRWEFTPFVASCENRLSQAVPLGLKSRPGPMPDGTEGKFIVVFQRIVERIEIVFDVPEHYYQGPEGHTDLSPHDINSLDSSLSLRMTVTTKIRFDSITYKSSSILLSFRCNGRN